MNLCGLQKTTLLDFPGKVAATIFTGGCNFRCPFCHNSQLLDQNTVAEYSTEHILAFLKKRKGILQGVCITGGEPTLQPDLESFICDIRALGLAVKLDTNGYQPLVLKNLCKKGLLDFVSMDIKAGRDHYALVAGKNSLALERIEESISFLLSGSVPYEFRTTVVRGLHTQKDFLQIGPWIKGCSQYYLQSFLESEQVLKPGIYSSFTKEEMLSFAGLLRPYAGQVSLRGVEY